MINYNKLTELTMNEFNKNKTNDRFIHNIAYAHGVQGWEGFNKALCQYVTGTDYKVSTKLQQKAIDTYQKMKENIINDIKTNELVFVGMGMDFKADKGFIGNHRIRTYFKDNNGIVCFVEFGSTSNNEFLRCDHALFNTEWKTNERSLREREEKEKRVYLENLKNTDTEYTEDNILKLLNECFNTNFNKVKVHSYCLNTNDYICRSKK